MSAFLIDAGPLIAFFKKRDQGHGWANRAFELLDAEAHTTSAVITETMHFLSGQEGLALADLIAGWPVIVHDLTQPSELREASKLMTKYSNVPMDYADATLVLLAERLGIEDILTLDRRGFAVFRTRDGKHLRMREG